MYHLQQSSTFFYTLVTFNSSPIWLPGKKGSTTKFFLSSWQLEKLEIFFQKHNFPWRSFCTLGRVLSLLFLSIGWNCQRKQSQFFRSPRKWDKILSKQHLTPVVINRLSCSVWWISVTSPAMWGDNRSRFHHFVVTTQISQYVRNSLITPRSFLLFLWNKLIAVKRSIDALASSISMKQLQLQTCAWRLLGLLIACARFDWLMNGRAGERASELTYLASWA